MNQAREAGQSKRNTNPKTAQMVQLISEIGPDIPEISRQLHQFKESVRYRYKEKILNKGFAVQAMVDHEKLGLRRVLLIADFAPEYKNYENAVLSAMHELCYVVYFEKRMLTDDYLIEASVPSEFLRSFMALMRKLKKRGLFSRLRAIPFDWLRVIPMNAQCYDFDTGWWDFDWSSPQRASAAAAYRPSGKVEFDRLDLLVLKELQVDATRSFTEIAGKLRENYKKLKWHYDTHVIRRRMIGGYCFRWMGTKYSSKLERALHRQHRYLHVGLLATSLDRIERMDLMAKLHGIPFMWSEMVGENDYFTDFYFPTESATEALQFLTRTISGTKERTSVMIMDQTEALSFTFSYQLFDERSSAWTFNEPNLLARFDSLIAKIREIGGP